jgi:hypothetical protein
MVRFSIAMLVCLRATEIEKNVAQGSFSDFSRPIKLRKLNRTRPWCHESRLCQRPELGIPEVLQQGFQTEKMKK